MVLWMRVRACMSLLLFLSLTQLSSFLKLLKIIGKYVGEVVFESWTWNVLFSHLACERGRMLKSVYVLSNLRKLVFEETKYLKTDFEIILLFILTSLFLNVYSDHLSYIAWHYYWLLYLLNTLGKTTNCFTFYIDIFYVSLISMSSYFVLNVKPICGCVVMCLSTNSFHATKCCTYYLCVCECLTN